MTDEDLIARVRERGASDGRLRRVASPKDVGAAEAALGFPLPALQLRLLTEVANGGFGPGRGFVGVGPQGFSDQDMPGSIETLYAQERDIPEDAGWWSPPGLVYLCNWGCGIWSQLDAKSPTARVVTGFPGDAGCAFWETASSLGEWLQRWVRGVNLWDDMHEPTGSERLNPFTREMIPELRVRGPRVTFDDRR